MQLMTAALMQRDYEGSIKARWQGGPTVLAFLFGHPNGGPTDNATVPALMI